ncbi:thiamine phosphate synthase [Marinomonas mediterranea]|uniref:thiamine phosphate synthase n=1 Tax=Marinomonas mediterranea TaxID=119864 RepID=UPI00234BB942|nr:thiamine phosphate synthase [Marinomonas mediterranea]WCN09129.1 thiamine phosphate synthase [Marinomonas mediterranea]
MKNVEKEKAGGVAVSASRVPVVWCVGGSDSSAHAGLQADLRTGQDLGCHVQTIVTSVTAQNSKQVDLVEPVSLEVFNQQWITLLDDVIPDAIKVSLLPTENLISECGHWLRAVREKFPTVPVIFDPVMAASTNKGNQLQESGVVGALLREIFPNVTLVTPNLHEAEVLLGNTVNSTSPSELYARVSPWLKDFNTQWFVKGGHDKTQDVSCDWLLSNEQQAIGFSAPRLTAHNDRGTGCTLSTAIASFMAHGYELLDALTLAKAYISEALSLGVEIGAGAGPLGRPSWPSTLSYFPTICSSVSSIKTRVAMEDEFALVQTSKMSLYPVLDSVEWLERTLKQGVKTAQLRIKNPNDPDLDEHIRQAIALGRAYDAQVFINDYWEKAIEYGAFGVHLGQEDLEIADLQQIKEAGLRLGISTHGYFEIAKVLSIKPSYVALGHIFPTQTKDMPSSPQGTKRLKRYVALLKGHYSTVAIGGISESRVAAVKQTGVDSIALVTAITLSPEPDLAIKRILLACKKPYDHESTSSRASLIDSAKQEEG